MNVSERFPDRREFPLRGGKAPLVAVFARGVRALPFSASLHLEKSQEGRRQGRRQGVVAISRAAKRVYLIEKFLPTPSFPPSGSPIPSSILLPPPFLHTSACLLSSSSSRVLRFFFLLPYNIPFLLLPFPYVPRFHVSLSLLFDSISLSFFFPFFLPVVLPRSSSNVRTGDVPLSSFSFSFSFSSFFLRFNQLGTPMRVRRVLSRGASRAWDSKHEREKEEIARRFSGKNGWRGWEGII